MIELPGPISDITKPYHPDFGYPETLRFDENVSRGWKALEKIVAPNVHHSALADKVMQKLLEAKNKLAAEKTPKGKNKRRTLLYR